jgi:hypothetical protein
VKEIVLATLAIDMATGEINPKAPFMVNSPRRGTRYNRPYEDEPGVTEQFRPGECHTPIPAVAVHPKGVNLQAGRTVLQSGGAARRPRISSRKRLGWIARDDCHEQAGPPTPPRLSCQAWMASSITSVGSTSAKPEFSSNVMRECPVCWLTAVSM